MFKLNFAALIIVLLASMWILLLCSLYIGLDDSSLDATYKIICLSVGLLATSAMALNRKLLS